VASTELVENVDMALTRSCYVFEVPQRLVSLKADRFGARAKSNNRRG
jgi:hypothetical protein